MREVLGAGRGVQAGEVETDAMRHKTARAYMYGYATHIKPQGFTSRPPLLTTNKVFLQRDDGACHELSKTATDPDVVADLESHGAEVLLRLGELRLPVDGGEGAEPHGQPHDA